MRSLKSLLKRKSSQTYAKCFFFIFWIQQQLLQRQSLSGQIVQACPVALICSPLQTMTSSVGKLWKLCKIRASCRHPLLPGHIHCCGTDSLNIWTLFLPSPSHLHCQTLLHKPKDLTLAKNCPNKENNCKKSKEGGSLTRVTAKSCFVTTYRLQPIHSYSSFTVCRKFLTKLLKPA